jgi:hypothetical protein
VELTTDSIVEFLQLISLKCQAVKLSSMVYSPQMYRANTIIFLCDLLATEARKSGLFDGPKNEAKN